MVLTLDPPDYLHDEVRRRDWLDTRIDRTTTARQTTTHKKSTLLTYLYINQLTKPPQQNPRPPPPPQKKKQHQPTTPLYIYPRPPPKHHHQPLYTPTTPKHPTLQAGYRYLKLIRYGHFAIGQTFLRRCFLVVDRAHRRVGFAPPSAGCSRPPVGGAGA